MHDRFGYVFLQVSSKSWAREGRADFDTLFLLSAKTEETWLQTNFAAPFRLVILVGKIFAVAPE
jgi:hypothetical protein